MLSSTATIGGGTGGGGKGGNCPPPFFTLSELILEGRKAENRLNVDVSSIH